MSCLATATRLIPQQMATRRSGNYKPSIWDDDDLQSLESVYSGSKYSQRAEKLKQDVKKILDETTDQLDQLELVDVLQRLGIYYHFENEIESILNCIYNAHDCNEKKLHEDLYVVALKFRLLRQQGYQIPQEVFNSFMEFGKFKKSFRGDRTKGILSLYEASYLAMEGETILDVAQEFAIHHLKEKLKQNIDQHLVEQVSHALEVPLHWRMQKLEARWFIEIYERRQNANPVLLELAKLDFNIVQATYQNEIKQMSKWYTSSCLAKKMSFARDRFVEGFLWAVGFTSEPQYGYCRRVSMKLSALITIVDDIYDVYGTLDELEVFTDVVERWDINALDRLPDYMKICFLAVFNSINEIAYDVLKEQGFNIIPYLRKMWAELCKAYLVDAKWYYSGYTPSLNEFLDNAWISITGPVLLFHAYFCITNTIKDEDLKHLEQYPGVIHWPSLILRLADDLGTSAEEMEKGDVPKSIQCYMHDTGCSEEDAREYIEHLTSLTWKKMNKDILMDRYLSKDFIRTAMNLARIAQCMYQHGDGFGVPDGETKDRIVSLLVKPIPLP